MIGLDRSEGDVDCFSDETGAFKQLNKCSSAQGCRPPTVIRRELGVNLGVNPHGQVCPAGTGQGALCGQSYIRVTAAGRPGTGPAGPRAKPRVSVTEPVSTHPLQEFIQTNAVKCLELQS